MSIKELKTPEGYTIVLDVKDAIVRVGDAWVPVLAKMIGGGE